MQNSKASVTIEMVPSKTLLISSKHRDMLEEHVKKLKEMVPIYNGKVIAETDYLYDVMLVLKFADFESCQAFDEALL